MYPSYSSQSPWDMYPDENIDLGYRNPAGTLPALPPIPNQVPGSGRTNSANSMLDTTTRTGTVTTRYPSISELEAITGNIRNTPEMAALRQSQDFNRDLFRQQLARPPQIDVATPLANLSDYVQTGKLGTRQPSENPKDAANRIREYAKQLQDDQRDIANTLFRGAQATKLGTFTEQQTELAKQHLQAKTEDPLKGARAKGLKTISAKQLESLAGSIQIPQLLSDMRLVVTNNADKFGPIEGRIRGLNPWDDTGQAIQAVSADIKQTIGKLKEGGVLREHDERKYEKILPTLADTPSTAMEKIDFLERDIGSKYNSVLNTLGNSGYDVSGLPQSFKVPGLSKLARGEKPPLSTKELAREELKRRAKGK